MWLQVTKKEVRKIMKSFHTERPPEARRQSTGAEDGAPRPNAHDIPDNAQADDARGGAERATPQEDPPSVDFAQFLAALRKSNGQCLWWAARASEALRRHPPHPTLPNLPHLLPCPRSATSTLLSIQPPCGLHVSASCAASLSRSDNGVFESCF